MEITGSYIVSTGIINLKSEIMENLKKANERLSKAILALHPNCDMSDPKQEEMYLAYHNYKIVFENFCQTLTPK